MEVKGDDNCRWIVKVFRDMYCNSSTYIIWDTLIYRKDKWV